MSDHYVHRAPELLKDMLDWGLDYYFSDQRAVFTSGIHIMDVLLKKARSAGVKMMEDVMAWMHRAGVDAIDPHGQARGTHRSSFA